MMGGVPVKQALLTFHRINLNTLNHNAVCRLCLKNSLMRLGPTFEMTDVMIRFYGCRGTKPW